MNQVPSMLQYLDEIYECLPSHLTAQFDTAEALRAIHFPKTVLHWKVPRRLILRNFYFIWGHQCDVHSGKVHKPDGPLVERFFRASVSFDKSTRTV